MTFIQRSEVRPIDKVSWMMSTATITLRSKKITRLHSVHQTKQESTWLHTKTQWNWWKAFSLTAVCSSYCHYQKHCVTRVQILPTFPPSLRLNALICKDRGLRRNAFSSQRRGYYLAMTYVYINVSGAKPKLYNLLSQHDKTKRP